MTKQRFHLLALISLIMAWLELVPYYGPTYRSMIGRSGLSYNTAQLVFVCVYFLTVILASFFINEKSLMKTGTAGASASILLSLAGWVLPFLQSMYILHFFLGIAAAMISIVFVYLFIYGFTPDTRMQATAGFELVVVTLSLLVNVILIRWNENLGFAATCLVLVILLLLSMRWNTGELPTPASIPERPIPLKLISLVSTVMFIIYLNINQKRNMLNILSDNAGIDLSGFDLHSYFIQILIYLVFLFIGFRVKRFLLIYATLILAALSYLSGLIMPDRLFVPTACYIASGCCSNLFAFTFIGDIALKYGRNFKTASLALIGVGIGSILGEFLGQATDSIMGTKMTMVLSVSIFTMFLSFLAIPWLAGFINREMDSILDGSESATGQEAGKMHKPEYSAAHLPEYNGTSGPECNRIPGHENWRNETDPLEPESGNTMTADSNTAFDSERDDNHRVSSRQLTLACSCLAEGNRLTSRELEIAVLLFERYDNQTIAQRLFISPNTLKVHIRRIYQKFQVTKRKEFIEEVRTLCAGK